MTSEPSATPTPPPDQPWSRRAVAVRVGGVALGLLVIALVVRFAVADREHQPGLIAPGSSTAQAGWQPGEYRQSVAPCQAVSGGLLGRLVRGAPADQDVSSNNPTKLCVWHVGPHTLIVRIQLHTPGGPASDQTASTLAGEDFAQTRQGVGAKSLPFEQAKLAPLAGLADEVFGVYDSSPPTYDVGRVVLHKRNALVDIQYQDSSRSPNRSVLQQAAIAVAEDVIKHFG
jgi:hypothetical protein